MKKQRRQYEKRIAALQTGHARHDLVDELARKHLQYAHPNDLVLFE